MQSQKQWIVLVNRTQQGPFSESEIQEFLADSSLKVSDLAYLVTGEKGFPEWKFLWQFPEFERRVAGDVPYEGDRRTPQTAGQIQAKIDQQVPPEFRNQAQAVGLAPPKKRGAPPENMEEAIEEAAKWRRATFGLVAGLIVFVALGAGTLFLSTSSSTSSTSSSASLNAAPKAVPPPVAVLPNAATGLPGARAAEAKRAPAAAPVQAKQASAAVPIAPPPEPLNTGYTTAVPIEIQNRDDEDYE